MITEHTPLPEWLTPPPAQALAPRPAPRPGLVWDNARVESFLSDSNIAHKPAEAWNSGAKWQLAECPFCGNSDHNAIVTNCAGVLGFSCSHNSCQGYHWSDFRKRFEPERVTNWPTQTTTQAQTAPPPAAARPARPPLADLVKLPGDLAEAKPAQWLVSGVLERGELCLITGKPGSQKSFLMLDLALAIASGQTWLPDATGEGGRNVAHGSVLWVNTDNGASHDGRVRAIIRERGLPDDTPLYSLTLSDWSLSNDADVSELAELAMVAGVTLVVIDTLASSAAGVDENSNGAMGVIWNKVKALRDATGATVIVIHHPPKADSEGIRGAGASEGVLDKWYFVDRAERGNSLTLKCQKYRNYPPALSLAVQSNIKLDGYGDNVALVGAAFYAGEQALEDARRDKLHDTILERAAYGAKNKSALAEAVKGKGWGSSAVFAAVNALIDDGAIPVLDNGRIPSLDERQAGKSAKTGYPHKTL